MLQLLCTHVGDARKGTCYRVINPDAIQHINLKIFLDDAGGLSLHDILAGAITVFHGWIKDSVMPEMLIDVADYGHVEAGPGVLLIGHEANYSIDDRDSRPGMLYNRKSPLEGTFRSRLEQAHNAALAACDRLEQETPFRDKLKFDRNRLEVFVNDRLLAPNNGETWQTLRPELESYFGGFTIEHRGEPRDLFRVAVTRAAH
jgi:hypothetical protein